MRSQFEILSEDDAKEVADETIFRTYRYCDFQSLSLFSGDMRSKKFFQFLKETVRSSAVDLIRQRAGRHVPTSSRGTTNARAIKAPSHLVWQVVGELSEGEQELLALKDVDQLTYEQIAGYYAERGMTVTVDALKKRRLRALAQLLRRLTELLDD